MEPAERTLFVFVHGFNPKCSGSINNALDDDDYPTDGCSSLPIYGDDEKFCVDRDQVLGKSGQVWLRNLDGEPDPAALFCTLRDRLFGTQYSLRSFSDPGESPVSLAHELGDRQWSTPQNRNLRSHVMEAMRRYAEGRRDAATAKRNRGESLSSFESEILRLHPSGGIGDLGGLFRTQADSMPSRMVVLSHSMGGLTTREYLMSDFYNGDLDKVVTYDSPHKGSWVAKYNQDGIRSGTTYATFASATKILIGFGLFTTGTTTNDLLGALYTVTAGAHLVAGSVENTGGYLANKFKGDEEGGFYLTPGAGVETLNRKLAMTCESSGCQPPTFTLYSTDGVLAPDDPKHLLGNSPAGSILPLELADMATAGVLAFGRDWPEEVGTGHILYQTLLAAAIAEGGWNYSQHGSFAVANHSSLAAGVPFFDRADLALRRPPSMVYATQTGYDAAGASTEAAKILVAYFATVKALSTWTMVSGDVWGPAMSKSLLGLKVGAEIGLGTAIQFGLFALSYSPSHNLAIWRGANDIQPTSYANAAGTTIELRPRRVETDLYEAPFAQIVSRRDPRDSTRFLLKLGTGDSATTKSEFPVEGPSLEKIQYSRPGWDGRWAVRHETQVPVQDSGTSVRKVERWNLPFELLTTRDLRSLDLQIDDLRPDLMEELSISINWGKHLLVWDREHGSAGEDPGTYTITHFVNGKRDSTCAHRANPVDRYGRWSVDLKAFIAGSVLQDGQNLLGISMVDHVGKRSLQRQFVTWQATPPLVAMNFPQPWEVVSTAPSRLDAHVTLLHYPGLAFEPNRSGWLLHEGDLLQGLPADTAWQRLDSLAPGRSEFDLVRPLPLTDDGAWTVSFQMVSTTDKGQTSIAERHVPFVLDRKAPRLSVQGPRDAFRPGDAQDFVIPWQDSLAVGTPILELVRLRILDGTGKVVAQPEPIPFASVGPLVVRWNGLSGNAPLPDGSYTLEVEARDGAVPDAATRRSILALKQRLATELYRWNGSWSAASDSSWEALRGHADLNWAKASTTFRLDGHGPKAIFDTLPARILGRADRLRIRLRLADSGSTSATDSVRCRFVFTPRTGTIQTKHALDAVYVSLAPRLVDASTVEVGEGNSPQELLPDGQWSVSASATDAAGNRTDWDDLGVVTIDRSPPEIASLRASHPVVPGGEASVGDVVLDLRGAASVSGSWVGPDGRVVAIQATQTDGLWYVAYPAEMKGSKGIWRLEIQVLDAAGNSTHASTQVRVDLVAPQLRFPVGSDAVPTVTGPIVLRGLAMDPDAGTRDFRSYALQWRWKGDSAWSSDGMRVPVGRSMPGEPWKSKQEQTSIGVLGYWTPPAGAGGIEVRLLVDDGTGDVAGHEDIREVYRSGDEPAPFSASVAIPAVVGTGISSRLGLDIQSASARSTSYQAQVTFVDSRGSLLLAKDLIDLKASRFDGRPASTVPGSFQLWKDSSWHLRANALCRAFHGKLLSGSDSDFAMTCPPGWTCTQKSIEPLGLPEVAGGITIRHTIDVLVPSGATGELVWDLDVPAQLVLEGDSKAAACAITAGECIQATPPEGDASWPFPQAGELSTGGQNMSSCEAMGALWLDPGYTSWTKNWNGLRPDGFTPAGGTANLEALVWDSLTGRLVIAKGTSMLTPGELSLRAWSEGEISVATDAPQVQHAVRLEFTVEGRGGPLSLEILRGDSVIKTLEGSKNWFEGRAATEPYGVDWDGSDRDGRLVTPGTYRFRVAEVGGKDSAVASVAVTGLAWHEDSTLGVSLPESDWDDSSRAFRLRPKPELLISTGATASQAVEGTFGYAADWSGKQDVSVFPASRFSLMVRRHRETVKFGILFHLVLQQHRKGNDGATCGGSDDDVKIEYYPEPIVLSIEHGKTVKLSYGGFSVQPTTNDWIYRFEDSPHLIEYLAVPLSQIENINNYSDPVLRWIQAKSVALSKGSFAIAENNVSMTFGELTQLPWAKEGVLAVPPNPFSCVEGLVDSFLDPASKGIQTSANSCGKESKEDFEYYNPHRNLLQFKILGSGLPQSWALLGFLNDAKLKFVYGNADAICYKANTHNLFGFDLEIGVPDSYWNPPPGMQNLANRYLRFDSKNGFLFGPNGYLLHDHFDNDGILPANDDDPGEREGTIAAFEHRTFRWRPRLSDLLRHEVHGVSNGVATASLMWTVPGIDELKHVVDSVKSMLLQSGDTGTWDDSHGTSEDSISLERANDDPLYFFEGDDGRANESLQVWFENTADQGEAGWEATIAQGAKRLSINSANRGVEHAASFPVSRGSGTGIVVNGATNWTADPVDISVALKGNVGDFQKSAWTLPIEWPLDSSKFASEKTRIEQACASSGTGFCRLQVAASGVRFGFLDGLAPANPVYGSSAQQAMFDSLAIGKVLNPGVLPKGFPHGSARVDYQGLLAADPSGSARFVDSTHFLAPPDGMRLHEPQVMPVVLPGFSSEIEVRLESKPRTRAIFQTASGSVWSLARDLRLGGVDRLVVPELWTTTSNRQSWPLLGLYQGATSSRQDTLDTAGTSNLYRYQGGWLLNPGLHGLALQEPRVAFINGDLASDAFEAQAVMGREGPEEIRASRATGSWGLPEWFPVRGAVAEGQTYRLGWREIGGSWHDEGGIATSRCTSEDLAAKRCLLGFVDASKLPAKGDVGILVERAEGRVLQLVPFVQGRVAGTSGTSEIRSLFGEASVAFPPEAWTGKSRDQRGVTVRALQPSQAGIPWAGSLSVTGPVIEILPSQVFSESPQGQPQVKVRVTKNEFEDLSRAVDRGLFKIDAASGTVIPLASRAVTFYCDTLVCDAEHADAVEFTGLASSFSRFAVLPLATTDSRSWSLDASPRVGMQSRRTLVTFGLLPSDLDWFLDDDAILDDPQDATPAASVGLGTADDGSSFVEVDPGRHWLLAVPKLGGLPKSVLVQREVDAFSANLAGPSRVVLGTVNGEARVPYASNRTGTWVLSLDEDSRTEGFVAGDLESPRGELVIPSSAMGRGWIGKAATRWTAHSATGGTISATGPIVIGDGRVPEVVLASEIRRSGDRWEITGMATGSDPDGALRSLRLEIRDADGRLLASGEGASPLAVRASVSSGDLATRLVRMTATAVDSGGNHSEAYRTDDLAWWETHSVWWIEAEELVREAARVPVCMLPSRTAIRSDSAPRIEWILPKLSGEFRLAGHWRSGSESSIRVQLGSASVGDWPLTAQPLWGDLAVFGPVMSIHAGDTLRLVLPPGTQWDGIALVGGAESLAGWHLPIRESAPRVRVYVRDEDPGDPNMSHPRIYVSNMDSSVLDGYRLRYQVRTETGQVPIHETWWPSPLVTTWETDGHDLWDLVMDRSGTKLESGMADFQGVGTSWGFHTDPWATWNRTDDPSWMVGTPVQPFVETDRIPVFDRHGNLISCWTCATDVAWKAAPPASASNGMELRGEAPSILTGPSTRIDVVAQGAWNWNTTVVGLTPLDGKPLEGTLQAGSTTWPLAGWWQEIRLPNASRQNLSVIVVLPSGRRVQIQKWEN